MPQTNRKIFLQLTSAGSDTGPFDISDSFANIIDTNVPKADLLFGKTYSVDLDATYVKLQSNGLCSNYVNINIDPIVPPSTNVDLNWSVGTTIGGRLVITNDTTSTTLLTQNTNGSSIVNGYLSLSFGNTYTVSGRWTSGSGNIINYIICDVDNSSEIYSTSTPITSTNSVVDYTFSLPLTPSTNSIGISLRSGGAILPSCT